MKSFDVLLLSEPANNIIKIKVKKIKTEENKSKKTKEEEYKSGENNSMCKKCMIHGGK